MDYKFAKNSIANDKRKRYIGRQLKLLKKRRDVALKLEKMDNDRYYQVLLTDTDLASYNNDDAKKRKVSSVVNEVSVLLKKRDAINSKLNAIYSGPLGDIAGAGESDKWRDVKVSAVKRHSKKLQAKANALKNSVPGMGEDKAKKIFVFNSLLDAKVEALATVDLCKYRLRKEKNNFTERAQINKDMAEAKKKIKLIDKEIKDRKNMILNEEYGSRLVSDFGLALGAIAVVGAGVVGYLHFFTEVDVIGIFDTVKNTLSPIVNKISEFVNSGYSISEIIELVKSGAGISDIVDLVKSYLNLK
jgi:hypothetical protein